MKIPGFYITLLGISISGIASIILAYDSNIYMYGFVTLGILITIIGAYIQHVESQTVRIRIDFYKPSGATNYYFEIPYTIYKKYNPIIDIQYEDGSSGTWETFIRPKLIKKDGTIVFETNSLPSRDLYCLIK